MTTAAVELDEVSVVRDGAALLRGVTATVPVGEHLVVLGPNGAGKTTLLRLLSGYLHPTSGTVRLLGETLGRTDVRRLRARIALVSTGIDHLLAHRVRVVDLVATGTDGATFPRPGVHDAPEPRSHALAALDRVAAAHLAIRTGEHLSQGEWQRVRIARALAATPELLLLDEPMAGLDVGGRESLIRDLDRLLAEPTGPTVVLVTHHLEEVPTLARRVLLLRDGRDRGFGPIREVLRSDTASSTFDIPLEVTETQGRFSARVARTVHAGLRRSGEANLNS